MSKFVLIFLVLMFASSVFAQSVVVRMREGTVGIPPAIDFSCPAGDLEVNEVFVFDATNSYCVGATAQAGCETLWEFKSNLVLESEDKSAIGAPLVTVAHGFSVAGDYSVTLTVTDSLGNSNKSSCSVGVVDTPSTAVPDIPVELVVVSVVALSFVLFRKR